MLAWVRLGWARLGWVRWGEGRLCQVSWVSFGLDRSSGVDKEVRSCNVSQGKVWLG